MDGEASHPAGALYHGHDQGWWTILSGIARLLRGPWWLTRETPRNPRNNQEMWLSLVHTQGAKKASHIVAVSGTATKAYQKVCAELLHRIQTQNLTKGEATAMRDQLIARG